MMQSDNKIFDMKFMKFRNYVEIVSNFTIPEDEVLATMTRKEIQWVYHTYVMSQQTSCKIIRMGHQGDGGWNICNEPRWKLEKGKCLVYSYGINFDFSFDDAFAKFGCEVHAFDPSMNTPSHVRGKR